MKVHLKTLIFVFPLFVLLALTDFDASFEVFSGDDATEITQAPPGERRRVRRRTRRRTRRRVERRMEKQSFRESSFGQNWYWVA